LGRSDPCESFCGCCELTASSAPIPHDFSRARRAHLLSGKFIVLSHTCTGQPTTGILSFDNYKLVSAGGPWLGRFFLGLPTALPVPPRRLYLTNIRCVDEVEMFLVTVVVK
jgi:hypothetical protein